MLADVLTSAGMWQSEQPLLTYIVPSELEGTICMGQLVAIPYGERLVEGIVWHVRHAQDEREDDKDDATFPLRPMRTILDPVPALLTHQRALAEWIAEYYVTPLAQVATMMLPAGLIQRSRVILRLVKDEQAGTPEMPVETTSPRLQALMGLLLADGELDVERLKQMLGITRAKAVMKEALSSGMIERDAQLEAPRAKKRMKRVVRLIAGEETLVVWRKQAEESMQQGPREALPVVMAPDNVRKRPRKSVPDPWAITGATATMTLTPTDAAGIVTQHQLMALDLLQHSPKDTYWTPHKLCQATKLTEAQLKALVRAQLISIEEVEIRRDPLLGRTFPPVMPLPLTDEQSNALAHILALDAHKTPILLHGVTGSGKTEVYLQALATIIAQGKRGIVLVPEIALTTQAIQRFAARFPGRVAIIHGDLYVGERYDEWRRIRSGEVDVVIGARSALFSPLPDLGMIILDEEHESAYKQGERRPTYHARAAAIALGRILHIPVVLGSATPSVETFYRAEQGTYQLIELRSRIGSELPPVEIIDLRNELHVGNTSIISRRLQDALNKVLSTGQQAILFLNRRGAASCILCRDCGYVAICERCDMPLTYHSTERILLCHYCNLQVSVLHSCPQCNSKGIRYFGLGTEKVMATIQQSFPTARLLRWDRDTASNYRVHQQLLDRFANREADILVGTQMIAKGLDLPGVTLVGVVSADIALNLPDFAASERAFTLLTQVAGRAGRGKEAGEVIVQTFNPQHFCIDAASRHDYAEFYAAEIDARRRYGYPPFRQFVKFTYSHENRRRSQNEALLLREKLDEWIERLGLPQTDIVGPAPALMERVRNKYHWQMIVRGPDLHPLLRVIDTPGWQVDIDPVSSM
ncbi:MAG TPA: primosomal protein N' [Ktedonobacteraceae bacterium]|nr:primosomal protein N' [Ktedonobacteraceae bacterium]